MNAGGTTSAPTGIARRTDASIREAVIAELKWEPRIVTPMILPSLERRCRDRDAAEKAAKRVYGVKAAANLTFAPGGICASEPFCFQ